MCFCCVFVLDECHGVFLSSSRVEAVLSDSHAESPNPAALLERLRAVVHPQVPHA